MPQTFRTRVLKVRLVVIPMHSLHTARVFNSTHILVLVPLTSALVIINCVSWVLVRLHTGGLPVQMGLGWPWCFYTYAVNRVGPSEFIFTALLSNIGVGVAILAAAGGLVTLATRHRKSAGWN